MRDTTIFLQDILAAIQSIDAFIAGMVLDAFLMIRPPVLECVNLNSLEKQ